MDVLLKNKIHCCFFLFLVISFLGCQQTADILQNSSRFLVVVPDAKNINYYTLEGTQQVNYQVRACYPGKKIIEDISKAMIEKKWSLLDEDFLNPGLKSNHAEGKWSTFEDIKGNFVYQWIEDWKDSHGNIIRYALRYVIKNKQDVSEICDMDVYGTFFPESLLNETLPKILKRKPNI